MPDTLGMCGGGSAEEADDVSEESGCKVVGVEASRSEYAMKDNLFEVVVLRLVGVMSERLGEPIGEGG